MYTGLFRGQRRAGRRTLSVWWSNESTHSDVLMVHSFSSPSLPVDSSCRAGPGATSGQSMTPAAIGGSDRSSTTERRTIAVCYVDGDHDVATGGHTHEAKLSSYTRSSPMCNI
jgi:hypothetical protein